MRGPAWRSCRRARANALPRWICAGLAEKKSAESCRCFSPARDSGEDEEVSDADSRIRIQAAGASMLLGGIEEIARNGARVYECRYAGGVLR